MIITPDHEFDIFVGSKIGSFKHIKYYSDAFRNNKRCIENLVNVKSLQKDDSITSMAWGNAEQTEILIGKQNQQIQVYDTIHGFKESYSPDIGTGHIAGLGRLRRRLVCAISSGVVKVWGTSEEAEFSVGGKIDRMRVYGQEFIATGGEENDLKVWNVSAQNPVFLAKNLPNDWLQLRRPIWVSDLCFLQETVLAVCSRHGYVRLYDTRAQRRPVCNVESSLAATCIAPANDERQVVVGFGRGDMHLVDLRRGRLDKGYKGANGAVTTVGLTDKFLVSAGLDRHLRVHNFDTKELVLKHYLTSKVSCLLVQTESRTPLRHTPDTDVKDEVEDTEEVAEDLDHIFQNMETVGDRNRKHTEDLVETKAKRQKISSEDSSLMGESSSEDPIKQLLKKTEKQKRKIQKKKKEKKAKSVFHNA